MAGVGARNHAYVQARRSLAALGMTDTEHAPRAALDVLVLPHTHWDREWYHPASRFRQRLVALVDELLDAPDSAPPAFLLDGQAVVLDDYLAVRPERRAALAAALAAGRLEAGPWYVLADALIPGAEALVRNLLAGRRALRALGAAPPPVLYCPDAFGHPASLPTLAAGFGCAVVVAWRGYGGARWPAGDAAWWTAPDGACALLYHLPPDGYEFGSRLPPALPSARERWAAMRPVLAGRARLGLALVTNGADHHALQERWAEAADALARAAAPEPVQATSLADFARLAAERAAAREGTPGALPHVRGELRDSYGYTWTLQGTFASRAAQKRRVARAERRLARDVEPWLALGALAGRILPPDVARGAALLRAAWRPLLECLPHDTLCGCSTDAVARAADARLDECDAQARGLRSDVLAAIAGHDADQARRWRDGWRPAAMVRNRVARPRGGVAEVELLTFLRDVPVGPGSADAWRSAADATSRGRGVPVILIDAETGDVVPVQVLDRAVRHDRVEAPRHYPDVDLVEAARCVAWVPPVAGYGLRSFALGEGGGDDAARARLGAGPATPVRAGREGGGAWMDNGRLRVRVDAGGAVRVEGGALGTAVPSLVGFEDVGDAGDLYTPSPVGRPITAAWCDGVEAAHEGPLRAELRVRYRMRVPVALARDPDAPLARPGRRAGRPVELPVTVALVLDAESDVLRVAVRGVNTARDHRFRLRLTTGVQHPRVLADAAFGPVARAPLDVPAVDQRAERVLPTAPFHRYVSLYGAGGGATVFSDGLAEYEAGDDGVVAVTLVRAVGELSRPDLPERPGHAGWPTPTPEAQGLGAFVAQLAVAWHGPDVPAVRHQVETWADDVLLPLAGETWRAALVVPVPFAGVALEGEGLTVSAVLPSDDGAWAVLRCVNVTDVAVAGAWVLPSAVREAWLARLDETPGAALAVDAAAEGARVGFRAGPRAVVTVLAR